jgi:hypothetical protein
VNASNDRLGSDSAFGGCPLNVRFAPRKRTFVGCTAMWPGGSDLYSLSQPFANAAIAASRASAFYRLKRAKYLVCNIYDATLKIIAVAKVRANIVIHICSSIAWQAGARPVFQPPTPGARAAVDDSESLRLIRTLGHSN